MNYLGHLFLAERWAAAAGEDAEPWRLGAWLSDFTRVDGLAAWPAPVQREIRRHWRLDTLTDTHPGVRAVRARFPDGLRRFSGIVLDLHLDHVLARDWARWHPEPLDAFAARAYATLDAHHDALPPGLRVLAPRIIERDWLGSYRQRDNVDHAVTRIARRLSRGGEGLIACLPTLREHEAEAEAYFEVFFPELRAFVSETRRALLPH